MVRNIILASFLSTISYFGALGAKDNKTTLICLSLSFVVWALCIWRCLVISRKILERNQAQRLFNEYMTRNMMDRR